MQSDANGHCHCDATRISVAGPPLVRGYCHCTICQAFNQGPYADITIFRARDVHFPADSPIEFRAYRSPPLVSRGKCSGCQHPAIEFLRLPAMPKLAILPSANIDAPELVPPAALHIFYDTRVADFDDGLPKYSSYLSSQIGFGRRIVAALLRG